VVIERHTESGTVRHSPAQRPGAPEARSIICRTRRQEDEIMTSQIGIRSETNDDIAAIAEVTAAAFATLEISNQTEPFIIEALRAAKVLTVSLVAVLDGRVVGHIAFSRVTISDGTPYWYGLGPVSVLPEYQRQGIGKALIHEGLSRLKRMRARGCCLVGHPEYYKKFGFENIPGLVYEGVPPEVFLALPFDRNSPQGTVTFHEAFKADGQPSGGE
jgi:putative acetyltransferase